MASLIPRFPAEFSFVDPGAGIGMLTAAVCERMLSLRKKRRAFVHVFEVDTSLLDPLAKVLESCREAVGELGHVFDYRVHSHDFVASRGHQGGLWDKAWEIDSVDFAIMNPPYFKVARDSDHARAMSHVVHGQPNMYALFMARATELLLPGGEMISITPRSFCGGLYFAEFRKWLFKRMSLRNVHAFHSRTDTFRDSAVLQESVITRFTKSLSNRTTISVSRSYGQDIKKEYSRQRVSYSTVVESQSGTFVIRIPENGAHTEVLSLTEKWPDTFTSLGYRVSTGPVVMFRAREYIGLQSERSCAPLLTSHHVRPYRVVWPGTKPNQKLFLKQNPKMDSLSLPVANYVLIRRFTSKEEKRRLVAGVFRQADASTSRIAFENHLNYVYRVDSELVESEALGLCAVLNSELFDSYFRSISGSTQVNATDLREMRMPSRETILRLGRSLANKTGYTSESIESWLREELLAAP
jgi:adenine-specific DNA-methyltransferase